MSRRSSSTPQDSIPSPNLEGLEGQILFLPDMVRIHRRGASTILREIRAGIFQPAPFASHPYRWFRRDLEEYFTKRPKRAPKAGRRLHA